MAVALLAASSLGAAAIHLAAGPTHVEELGDIGLGFYGTAMFQIALGVGFLRAASSGTGRRLRRAALLGSLGISAVWAISRTVGLPFAAEGAESIGTADLVATILQIITVIVLVADARRGSLVGGAPLAPRVGAGAPVSLAARAGLVAVVAVIALSSTIGVADATAGHVDGHGHPAGAIEAQGSVDAPASTHHSHGEAPSP